MDPRLVCRERPRRAELGQALPLVAVVLVIAGLVGLGVVHVGRAVVVRARAQAAADAAALAGAAGTRQAAAKVAAADGASLVAFRAVGADVVVTVELAGDHASARARAVRLPAAAGGASAASSVWRHAP